MAFRGTESPMDFEWQSRNGPVDSKSPWNIRAMENRKRPHSAFDSPSKPTMQHLREPNSQPFFFSQPPSLPEQSPYRAPSFTTPRKPLDFNFDSSGPENSSPADQADNEDTPDATPNVVKFINDEAMAGQKRNSLAGLYGRFAPSPPKSNKKSFNTSMVKKIHRQRRKAINHQLVPRRPSDPSSSEEDSPTDPTFKPQVEEVGWLTGLFTFIHKYPDAPSIIAKYLQVLFNFLICFGCLYMIYSFWATIKADVDKASDDAMAEVLSEMATCSKNYVENRCGSDQRLPALESICSNWELCMNRDPSAVKRAKVSAHTFAEILNSFVEPISLKTMLFSFAMVAMGLIVNNATFAYFRSTVNPPHDSRQVSGQYMQQQRQRQDQFGWHAQHDGLGYGHQQHLDYNRSPSKEYAKRARSRSPEKKRLFLE